MTKLMTVTAAFAVALALAACGSDDSSSEGGGAYSSSGGGGGYSRSATTQSEGKTQQGAGSEAALVSVGTAGDLGRVLVDEGGMTLYDFHRDKGSESACYGGCAAAWPPLLSEGKPKAEKGAEDSMLGTTKRNDGTVQVTYAGHPLYTYTGDSKPGEANGNDIDQFGAEWYALTPAGSEPED